MEREIEASTTIRAPLARAAEVLRDFPGCVLTDEVAEEHRRLRQVPAEVMIAIGSGATLQQDVMVRLGSLDAADDAVVVPLAWRPLGHERVLPDFQGELVVDLDELGNTRLHLRGRYHVPLGAVGRFGDSVVGRRLARRSLTALVEDAARRLDAQVDHRCEMVPRRPAPYPVDLREGPGSEIHLG